MALKPLKTLNFGGEDTYYLKPDWKNIAETTVIGDTLTWDGNTDGLYYNENMPYQYHVSDIILTANDLVNGGSMVVGGTAVDFTLESAFVNTDDGFIMLDSFMIVPTDNYILEGVIFEKKGLYFLNDSGTYCSSLTINGYNGFEMTETVKIPEKYLPSGGMVVDLGSPTLTDGAYEIADVSYTPFYEQYIKGNNVVFKISGSDYVNYASLVFANVVDGMFLGMICDTTGIVMVIFTTP